MSIFTKTVHRLGAFSGKQESAKGALVVNGDTKQVVQRVGPRHDSPRITIALGGGSGSFLLLLLGIGLLAGGLATGSYSMFVAGAVITAVFGAPLALAIVCLPCIICAHVLADG